MMPPDDAGQWIGGDIPGGKKILPAPFPGGIGIFPFQGVGQIDGSMSGGQILIVENSYLFQMVLQERNQTSRKRGKAVLVPFAGAHSHLSHLKVQVFDPQPDGFQDSQSAAVKQFDDELWCAFQKRNDFADFIARQHDGHVELAVGSNLPEAE